jgi:hypothetical protein
MEEHGYKSTIKTMAGTCGEFTKRRNTSKTP